MTGEFLPVVLRLRSELDRLEAIAKAACRRGTQRPGWKGPAARWSAYQEGGGDGYAIQSADGEVGFIVGWPEELAHHIAFHDPAHALRTIQAHRKIIERYETAVIARDAAVDTPLAGATRMALRLEREHLELVASIYFPESDATT